MSTTMALWAVPVVVGMRAQALLGDISPRVAATELFGVQSGRYLGYCPLPLILYFACAMLVRHPVGLIVAWRVRRALGGARDARAQTVQMALACCWWAALAISGALFVGGMTRADDAAAGWTLKLASITTAAGFPCLAVATSVAVLARRAVTFWLATPLLLAVLTLFSFGLTGSEIPVILPGRIEMALTSGSEALQSRAITVALGWMLGAWLVAVACALVRSVRTNAPARKPVV